MTTILRIDASARVARSISRDLADRFLDAWTGRDPNTRVIRRDVGVNPPPFISEDWIAAVFSKTPLTAEQQRLVAASDAYIAELAAADMIVIATPMYNYGMPAALKAWFDQVVRINKTFTFDLARGDRPLEPIFAGKTLVLLTSWGEFGFGPGEINEGGDHLTHHIRFAARYLGVDETHHVGVEYQEFGDDRHEASKRAAFAAIPELAGRLSLTPVRDVA